MKECILAHWRLRLTPDDDLNTVGAEPLWRNHRFAIPLPKSTRDYCRDTLEFTQLSDIVDSSTHKIFTRSVLRRWIRDLHREKHGWQRQPLHLSQLHISNTPEEPRSTECTSVKKLKLVQLYMASGGANDHAFRPSYWPWPRW